MTQSILAYVFWHWKRDSLEAREYEMLVADFHQSFANNRPSGFVKSLVYRIANAPWTPVENAYEEWYLLQSSAALDVINEAAVATIHRNAHDLAARSAAGGTAGLYRLRVGQANPARISHWFSKPVGMTYPQLESLASPLLDNGASLWIRQMVLGPAPECCLHLTAETAVPTAFQPVRIAMDQTWPPLG